MAVVVHAAQVDRERFGEAAGARDSVVRAGGEAIVNAPGDHRAGVSIDVMPPELRAEGVDDGAPNGGGEWRGRRVWRWALGTDRDDAEDDTEKRRGAASGEAHGSES
jgi:hypothetical protein